MFQYFQKALVNAAYMKGKERLKVTNSQIIGHHLKTLGCVQRKSDLRLPVPLIADCLWMQFFWVFFLKIRWWQMFFSKLHIGKCVPLVHLSDVLDCKWKPEHFWCLLTFRQFLCIYIQICVSPCSSKVPSSFIWSFIVSLSSLFWF